MLQTIATYYTPLDAHVARAQLESVGIPAVVTDEHMNAVYGHVAGGSRLQVPSEYATKAQAILAESADSNE